MDEIDLQTRTNAELEEENMKLRKHFERLRNFLHDLLAPKNLQDEKNNAEQADELNFERLKQDIATFQKDNEQLWSTLCNEQNKAKQVEKSSKRNRRRKPEQWFKTQVYKCVQD